jgi:hypothetical protein
MSEIRAILGSDSSLRLGVSAVQILSATATIMVGSNPIKSQAPMTKFQTNARPSKAPLFLGVGAWSLGFDWDLAPWSLVIGQLHLGPAGRR